MKMTQSNLLICGLALLFLGCNKADYKTPEVTQDESITLDFRSNNGAIQIEGIGYFADETQCDVAGEGADFALLITGDLEGCLYVYVEEYDCSPSGTYREEGQEYFVGTYNGGSGTFWTNYKFEGKFEGCEDGFFVGAEIFGRCQHPIQDGSGTGVFEGVSGRFNIKDEVETGEFPYKGHLKF